MLVEAAFVLIATLYFFQSPFVLISENFDIVLLSEMTEKKMKREERPSVLKLLKKLKEMVAARDPVRNKDKELSR